jgi:4-amino-4-deoxy-L-arabinose transferase-like glycosyltransferase
VLFLNRPLQSTTRASLLLFGACLLFHLAGTWIIPLIDRDEPRFAEATREMMERNDYVVPYFNAGYRFDKPPLTYWAQALSYRIFGASDFAARFPSAVAAALVAVVLFHWGRRLGRNEIGWWAAIIFSLSLQVVEHAKAAVADMWLVLLVTIAHWAAYELLQDQLDGQEIRTTEGPPRAALTNGWWWIFYLSLALAFLAKGPIGWTPLLTVGATRIFIPHLRVWRRFAFIPGIALMLGAVCLWGVPALLRTHGEFFRVGIGRHVLGRSVTAIGGHGAASLGGYLLFLPFYFVTIFFTFFPWSIKLPWLAGRLRRERDALDIYLLCGVAVIFGIFTLVTTRLVHYTLPAFPLLALLLAKASVGKGKSVGLFFRRCAQIAVPAYLILVLLVAPFISQLFPARELFRQSQNDLRPEMKFGALEFTEPSLVWYFRSRVKSFMAVLDRKEVASFMAEEGPRFAILPTAAATKLFPTLLPGWKSYSTSGFNLVKGKRTEVTLILKPE